MGKGKRLREFGIATQAVEVFVVNINSALYKIGTLVEKGNKRLLRYNGDV
jgi:hypothetical protein